MDVERQWVRTPGFAIRFAGCSVQNGYFRNGMNKDKLRDSAKKRRGKTKKIYGKHAKKFEENSTIMWGFSNLECNCNSSSRVQRLLERFRSFKFFSGRNGSRFAQFFQICTKDRQANSVKILLKQVFLMW